MAGVLVLGPVGGQEQQRSRRQALEQILEQRLSFSIQPVEVLEHQQQRLCLALG